MSAQVFSSPNGPPHRIAMLSLHSSPLAELGGEIAGGMNVFLREVTRELHKLGVELDIFTRRDDPDQPSMTDLSKGIRLIQLSAGPPISRSRDQLSSYIPEMTESLNEWPADRYDLIHAHYWISGVVGRSWNGGKRPPFVQMFHTMERTKRRLLGDAHKENHQRSSEEYALGRSATALTVGSPRDRDSLIGDYGIPSEKIHIVPGGVNAEVFFPRDQSTARSRVGLPEGRVILFVGRIEPVKGLETLIRALTILRRQEGDHCRWRLVIIGGDAESRQKGNGTPFGAGPPVTCGETHGYRADIVRLIHELGMEDRVSFLGSKPQDILADYYAAADCCVFPSVYETFGLAVIEALSCGSMVVASNVGGYPQMLAQKNAGLLVPPGDAGALARALDRVCANPMLREELRKRAPAVGQQFNWSDTAVKLMKVYRSVLSFDPEWEDLSETRSMGIALRG